MRARRRCANLQRALRPALRGAQRLRLRRGAAVLRRGAHQGGDPFRRADQRPEGRQRRRRIGCRARREAGARPHERPRRRRGVRPARPGGRRPGHREPGAGRRPRAVRGPRRHSAHREAGRTEGDAARLVGRREARPARHRPRLPRVLRRDPDDRGYRRDRLIPRRRGRTRPVAAAVRVDHPAPGADQSRELRRTAHRRRRPARGREHAGQHDAERAAGAGTGLRDRRRPDQAVPAGPQGGPQHRGCRLEPRPAPRSRCACEGGISTAPRATARC